MESWSFIFTRNRKGNQFVSSVASTLGGKQAFYLRVCAKSAFPDFFASLAVFVLGAMAIGRRFGGEQGAEWHREMQRCEEDEDGGSNGGRRNA
jgi:hypothetical protein